MGIAPCADESSTSLVTAMAGRLRHAEQSANALREEGKKKDATIQQLRVELSKVMRGVEEIPKGSDADIAILKDSNAKLREMLRRADAECKQALSENVSIKKFLKDYGMTWVGEEGAQSNRSSTQKERDPPRGIQYVGKAEGRCSPQKDKSTPSLHISDDSADEPATKPSGGKDFLMNAGNWQVPGEENGVPDLNSQAGVEALGTAFDEARILSNVKKLNHVAGEGQKEIVSGADGIRRLREKCTVSYIFYKNGIYARGGPLRPFNVRESKVLVRDLMDGYFPWELKDEYPEGVPLRVEMRLDEVFIVDLFLFVSR